MLLSMFNLRRRMFSVGDVVEYSDLSPWEPVIIVDEDKSKGSITIEFLDGDQLEVLPSEVSKLTWETIRELDEQRENCVREIQVLRQANAHLKDVVASATKIVNTLP